MKKSVIWDLDGTLLDSYDVIVESIYQTFLEQDIICSKEEIHQHAIRFSISSMFFEYAQQKHIDVQLLKQRYSQISSGMYLDIKVMNHGREVLQELTAQGVENYVFTHRGKTTIPVLDNLGLTPFFREIITSQHGFARKPDPEGLLYLISKYKLDPAYTCYVGDRKLDMDCAQNAGIPGVLYMPKGSFDVSGSETYLIKDLLALLHIQ